MPLSFLLLPYITSIPEFLSRVRTVGGAFVFFFFTSPLRHAEKYGRRRHIRTGERLYLRTYVTYVVTKVDTVVLFLTGFSFAVSSSCFKIRVTL